MKIAIVYICTGKYYIFWDSFYKSSQTHLLNNHKINYFVFTDSKEIKETPDVKIIYKESKGFPYDSLYRFDLFLSIDSILRQYDYTFFFNSNMKFVDSVGDEILPKNEEEGLIVIQHPGYFNKNPFFFPYERNVKSTSYIKYTKDIKYNYYMGGINGGKTERFLQLCKECSDNIRKDENNGILAIYHDESHLNKFIINKKVRILSPSYGFPEDSKIPFKPKIIILNKIKHGGKYFDKLPSKSYVLRLKLKLRQLYCAAIWKFQQK